MKKVLMLVLAAVAVFAGESPAANKCMSQALYGELRESLMRQVSKGVPIDSIEGQIKNSMGMEMQ